MIGVYSEAFDPNQASSYVLTIKRQQDFKVYVKMGYVNNEKRVKPAIQLPKSVYGKYLLNLIKESKFPQIYQIQSNF